MHELTLDLALGEPLGDWLGLYPKPPWQAVLRKQHRLGITDSASEGMTSCASLHAVLCTLHMCFCSCAHAPRVHPCRCICMQESSGTQIRQLRRQRTECIRVGPLGSPLFLRWLASSLGVSLRVTLGGLHCWQLARRALCSPLPLGLWLVLTLHRNVPVKQHFIPATPHFRMLGWRQRQQGLPHKGCDCSTGVGLAVC